MALDREEVFGKSDGPEEGESFLYCIHCERTYPYGKYKIADAFGENLQLCPYPECDGDTVLDAKDWDSIRAWHPEYPEIPEPNKIYPLN